MLLERLKKEALQWKKGRVWVFGFPGFLPVWVPGRGRWGVRR